MTTELSLDHVGVVVADLEAARQDYARLGFQLTPESPHEGRLTADGPVETWGSGNHCAMFHRGYLELLGITDPTKYHQHLKELLERYPGLQLIALGCADAAAVRARWANGLGELQPIAEIGRAVPQVEGGTRAAGFRIVYLDDRFPEAMLFAIEHANPEALWQPGLLEQPNGVTALRGATIVSADPSTTARRLSRLGLDGAMTDGGWRVRLAKGGWIDVIAPEECHTRYPGETEPAVPSVVAAAYEVGDLDASARYLEGAGVAIQAGNGHIRISAKDAQGCVIELLAPGTRGG